MSSRSYSGYIWFLLALIASASLAQQPRPLPATKPLLGTGDLSVEMVAGIDRFLMREIGRSEADRARWWRRDFSSNAAYEKSVEPNRERFRRMIGAVDSRLPVPALESISTTDRSAVIGEAPGYTVSAVRWPVFPGVEGEGLLLQPKGRIRARVVAVPDADQTPEMLAGLEAGLGTGSQFARHLARNGCQVIVPVLIDRRDNWSGTERLRRFTNQPHREWVYRQAYEMGRHIIGYEVQKIQAAVDWLAGESDRAPAPDAGAGAKVGVIGYGEGGLLALYSGALDRRIASVCVSGYFDSRDRFWEEPIYRNLFGLLGEFGDAEVASLIAPRTLVIEHSVAPEVAGPPPARSGRSGAAPGRLRTPEFHSVEREVERARGLLPPAAAGAIHLVHGNEGVPVRAGSSVALREFLKGLGVAPGLMEGLEAEDLEGTARIDRDGRQRRQFEQLVAWTQELFRRSEEVRRVSWPQPRPETAAEWSAACAERRRVFGDEVIGRFPKSDQALNPRSRRIYDKPNWEGYEVVLDVYPDVFAWGYLLVPRGLKEGERRPAVVCQHGLEGVPADTVTEDPKDSGFGPYRGFAARLADRGFVVFAPHNPYRGRDQFRVLQRKANPLGKSLFSVILAQHDRILDWLSAQPFIDPDRIGFYGLSYGGKTAMRVPALLGRYALSICSADFNEWIQKNVTVDSGYSYMLTGEYEMFEFNLGHTFNYAEMAALIAPRPFMVERGHHDGVAPDEWVAYEYAKVRRLYAQLGIPDRTEIEFFNGPHTINGVGTFRFLHRHLDWPEPATP